MSFWVTCVVALAAYKPLDAWVHPDPWTTLVGCIAVVIVVAGLVVGARPGWRSFGNGLAVGILCAAPLIYLGQATAIVWHAE